MKSLILLLPLLAGAQTPPAPPTVQPNTEFRVKLLAPMHTDTNKKGDKITAQVVSPQTFQGSMMEGRITESKSSGKIKGTSVLSFTFETLHYSGREIRVQSQVTSVVNSKGQSNVDEEGRVIEKKNNLGKLAIATGAGTLLGAVIGGGKGAAIGAGAGAAAGLILIQVGTQGASVSFATGTEFVLTVVERQ